MVNNVVENPYKSPSSDLLEKGSDDSIEQFTRFSAWGVFGLSVITIGIYPIYWLYSRAKVANSIHQKKIHEAWLIGLVLTTTLSFSSSLFGSSDLAVYAGLVITFGYLISYIVVLFKVRNRLQDIMDREPQLGLTIGPALTFFFNTIYLQYKINECIDTRANNKLLV